MSTPQKMNISALVAGDRVLVYWKQVSGANEYQMDACIDESLEDAMRTLSWDCLESEALEWAAVGEKSWEEIRQLSSRGLSWRAIDFSDSSWEGHDTENRSWHDLMNAPSQFSVFRGAGTTFDRSYAGLMWQDIDQSGTSWQEMEARQYDWAALEQLGAAGVDWSDLDARFLNSETWEAQEHSWEAFEQMSDNDNTYLSCWVPVPKEGRYMVFGLYALDENGDRSPCLLSAAFPILYKDQVDWSGAAFDRQTLLLGADSVKTPESKQISIHVDSPDAKIEQRPTDNGATTVNRMYRRDAGLRLKTRIQADADNQWSGAAVEMACEMPSDADRTVELVSQTYLD